MVEAEVGVVLAADAGPPGLEVVAEGLVADRAEAIFIPEVFYADDGVGGSGEVDRASVG